MRHTRRRDTQAELVLRSILHRRGHRYRVDQTVHPGTRARADLIFRRKGVAIFVDGCFWHACPIHATWPRANGAWWRRKLEGNVERDRRTDALLEKAGWTVIRIWEHEDPSAAADRIETILGTLKARAGKSLHRRERTG